MDWNALFESGIDAGLQIYDDATYSEEERIGDQLTAAEIQMQREALAAQQAQQSSGGLGGMDTTTLLLIGGALVAVLVLAK